MEAQKLITMSLGKIATSRSQRGGINLHKNLLVASVLHKARTVYMMDAYQHIIASRKQKQETGAAYVNSGDESTENNVASANTAGSGSAMTHAPPISHAMDKENSPPTAPADANPANKGAVCSAEGVENTTAIACPDNMVCELSEESENLAGVTECKSQTTTKTVPESADTTRVEKSDCALKNSTVSNTVISPGKRRRSLTSECVDSICDPVTGPKKAKLDIPTSNMENFHSSEEKENLKNSNDNEILCDYDEISSVRDSGVICLVTKSCDKSSSEPMQTEQTQITSLVTIFNSGFSGLCSRNSNSESNLNGQAQPLSCATELKSETVQIPSGIALTV